MTARHQAKTPALLDPVSLSAVAVTAAAARSLLRLPAQPVLVWRRERESNSRFFES